MAQVRLLGSLIWLGDHGNHCTWLGDHENHCTCHAKPESYKAEDSYRGFTWSCDSVTLVKTFDVLTKFLILCSISLNKAILSLPGFQ